MNELTVTHPHTGEVLSPINALTALVSPESLQAQTALVEARDRAIRALVGRGDSKNGYWVRSAYRKMGRAFHLSQETIKVETQFFDPTEEDEKRGIPFHVVAQVQVRTIAPWGQSVVTTGTCTTREATFYSNGSPRLNGFMRAEHDCTSKAETRAKNKGIDDLLAIGRADEIEEFDEDKQKRMANTLLKLQSTWQEILTKYSIEPVAEQAYYSLNPHLPENESLFEITDYQRCLRHFNKHGVRMFERAEQAVKNKDAETWERVLDQAAEKKAEPPAPDETPEPEPQTLAEVDKETGEKRIEAERTAGVVADAAAEKFFSPEELLAGGIVTPPPVKPTPKTPASPGVKEKVLALAEMEDICKSLGHDETYPLQFASLKVGRDLESMADVTAAEAIRVVGLMREQLAGPAQ